MVRSRRRVFAHSFSRSCVRPAGTAHYWRDVGTLDTYWNASIELTRSEPGLNVFDRGWPIPTTAGSAKPSRFGLDDRGRGAARADSMIGSGCVIGAASIRNSVIFSDVQVHHYADMTESVILPNVQVGLHVTLKRAIVDKHCTLPPGLTVGVNAADDRRRFHVTASGITLITPQMLGQRLGGGA